jgi:hypothetical protein
MSDVQNKKSNDQPSVVRRRGFLAGAATTGAVGAAALATGMLSKQESTPVVVDESASKGYQLSEHVRRYYRSTTV